MDKIRVRGLRTINVDKPVGLTLWMSPALQGAKRAARLLDRIYYSPAMAYIFLSAETQEEWDNWFACIEIEDIDETSPQGEGIYLHPGTKQIPFGPIDKRRNA
jgi:hypothetical protein